MKVGINGAVRDISDLKAGVSGAVRAVSEAYVGVAGAIKKVWPLLPIGTQIVLDAVGSGTWECPVSGNWEVELHGGGGGGGGGARTDCGAGGGGSGEIYSAYFDTGAQISYKIGSGGSGGSGYDIGSASQPKNGNDGESTTFGSYTISGGGGGSSGSFLAVGGESSGSLATEGGNGKFDVGNGGLGNSENPNQVYGNGGLGGSPKFSGQSGQDGAIILTYLG